MAWVAVAGTAISAGSAVFKGIQGAKQTAKANAMKPVNPGYQINQGVIDNARTVNDIYGNYTIPGYSQAVNNINSGYQSSFENGLQGATSGADILDLATRMAYGKNQAFNNLATENATGKQGMLGQVLGANAAAGQEYQNRNAYDRDIYQGQLREKAALTQAGAENTYGAFDQIAGAAGKFAFSKAGDTPLLPPGGQVRGSVFNKYFYPDGSPRFDSLGNPLKMATDLSSSTSLAF